MHNGIDAALIPVVHFSSVEQHSLLLVDSLTLLLVLGVLLRLYCVTHGPLVVTILLLHVLVSSSLT